MGNEATAGIKSRTLVSAAITEADTNTTKKVLEIPAKTFVRSVQIVVTEAFAGGTPSLDVGDGDDPDGWIDTADITETTIGSYRGTEANTANEADLGKYYAAADTIDVVVSASLTDGTAYVIAEVVDLGGIV